MIILVRLYFSVIDIYMNTLIDLYFKLFFDYVLIHHTQENETVHVLNVPT